MNAALRVLIVEDSESDALLLLAELRKSGYEPDFLRVDTAAALTAALAARDLDIVISDYHMPQFTGADALKLVQQSGLDLPFILVSGAVGEEEAVAVVKSGAQDFLLKDRLARLGPAVARALRDAEERRHLAQAEADLRESQASERARLAELETLMDVIPAAVFIAHDAACQKISGNRAALELRRLLLGNPLGDTIGARGPWLAPHQLPMQQAADTGQAVIGAELEINLPQDGKRFLLGSAIPLFDDSGAVRGCVGSFVDISAQKRVEEQIRLLNLQLESRVLERTNALAATVEALEAEMANRQRLEREILEISEREQDRLGQDLHDGLGQELAGISMLGEALVQELRAAGHPSAEAAEHIADYTRSAISSIRSLAKGLYPIELTRYGLLYALEDLANQTRQRFHVDCKLNRIGDASPLDPTAAIHVYRIVQECISNAIRHGKANRITIEAKYEDSHQTFTVTDNGSGVGEVPPGQSGMGRHIMDYRCRIIGGELRREKSPEGGCRVACRLPA